MTNNRYYPSDIYFDIETLVNVAQPDSILLIGDPPSNFLADYRVQKELLQQTCELKHISSDDVDKLADVTRHDVAIAINIFEHIDKQQGIQLLSRMRDLLAHQYCIALPFKEQIKTPQDESQAWYLTDLFGFAMERVATYRTPDNDLQLGLFKYNIN
ncbi:MAG: hypothetical protein KTR16_04090 [Acidiferrobacterales bacterium]|nr:hypothetical protein [Acidiferrobacterales bacterium]